MTDVLCATKRVQVIGDWFKIFTICIPIKDDKSETLAHSLYTKWVSLFGTPEKLLSDRGRNIMGTLTSHMCDAIDTKKVKMTSHNPQTNGMIEIHNRTLVDIIQGDMVDEELWVELLRLVNFQCMTLTPRSAEISPYEAMFGTTAFEVGHGMMMGYHLYTMQYEGPLEFRLKDLHEQLFNERSKKKGQDARNTTRQRNSSSTKWERR